MMPLSVLWKRSMLKHPKAILSQNGRNIVSKWSRSGSLTCNTLRHQDDCRTHGTLQHRSFERHGLEVNQIGIP